MGMIAHLIPHIYIRSNPFYMITSNKDVIDIEGMILSAKSEGTATITVTTIDGKYSDSINISVSKKYEYTVSNDKTYTLIPENFNFIENDYSYEASLEKV